MGMASVYCPHSIEGGADYCTKCRDENFRRVLVEHIASLEAEIERLKSPAVVLQRAEELLRAADVAFVQFYGDCSVELDTAKRGDSVAEATLAEAYAALVGEEGGGHE